MAKDKKEKVEKKVKVVDEVKVEAPVEAPIEKKVVEKKPKGRGKVIALTQRTATFEDGTVIRITRAQHSQIVNGTFKG